MRRRTAAARACAANRDVGRAAAVRLGGSRGREEVKLERAATGRWACTLDLIDNEFVKNDGMYV